MQPRLRSRPVGYFECGRRIETLKRFRDLLIRRERWAPYVHLARPLGELLPQETAKADEPLALEQQISRLQPTVRAYLKLAGIGTEITHSEPTYDKEKARVLMEPVGNYDLITHYFTQPSHGFIGLGQEWFEQLIRALEGGIAVYELRRERAWREKFNPLIWFAALLRAPVFVLERAGVILGTDQERSALLRGYIWLLRALFLAVLALAAAKLGFSVPWQQIFK